jgi:hypothetical protein
MHTLCSSIIGKLTDCKKITSIISVPFNCVLLKAPLDFLPSLYHLPDVHLIYNTLHIPSQQIGVMSKQKQNTSF